MAFVVVSLYLGALLRLPQWLLDASPVGQTTFERASSRPSQLTQLRYDDRNALVAMGIIPREQWRYANEDAPRAFPNGFVADPPNW